MFRYSHLSSQKVDISEGASLDIHIKYLGWFTLPASTYSCDLSNEIPLCHELPSLVLQCIGGTKWAMRICSRIPIS